ncbi:ABC transporter permease subunit [Nocardioides pacificus]
MTTTTVVEPSTARATRATSTAVPDAVADAAPQRFVDVLHAEWIKLWTVRSTGWSIVAMVTLGVGLTVLVCATSAQAIADNPGDHPSSSYVTWGMMIAQVTAVVLGAMIITSEYATGLAKATFAASPRRGQVLGAKLVVLTGTLLVAGTATAFLGYLGGNWFLDSEGVGTSLDSEGVLRALFGNGLYLAALGLLTVGVGLLVRHTAAALSIVLGLVFVVGNMAFLLPGTWGEWVAKLMPGNAGTAIITPVPFNPDLLGAWTGLGVVLAEALVVLIAGYVVLRRRDA